MVSDIISDIPHDKIIQAAMKYGADFAEIFAERTSANWVTCDDKRIEQASTFYDVGVGIRVIADGHTAYGSTNDLSKKSLLTLAREVGIAARAKHTKPQPMKLTERLTDGVVTVKQHPFGVSLKQKCDMALRADEVAWSIDDKIKQVKIVYRDRVRRTMIASSDGIFACDEQVGTLLATQVIAGDGNTLQTGYETVGGTMGFEIFDETPPEALAEKAARRALRMLTAAPAPAGSMPIILSSESGGTMIHEAVGHGLEADLAGEGLSVYSNRIGEKVASELVSVADDATMADKRGSFTFDDEGTPAARNVLIEDGILKGYLQDKLTSEKYSSNSTGNGRRQSYEYSPIVRMTNTLILPGKHDPAAILAETSSGLFVKRMGGGQVNTINGDFVFDVQEGYLIENGKLGEAVRGATLVGNGPKVLTSIDRVGSDLGFSIGTCGKDGQEAPVSCGQPTIRIPELVVGGTA
jgi:TldD protein